MVAELGCVFSGRPNKLLHGATGPKSRCNHTDVPFKVIQEKERVMCQGAVVRIAYNSEVQAMAMAFENELVLSGTQRDSLSSDFHNRRPCGTL